MPYVKRGMLEICATAECSILNIPVEVLFARLRPFLTEISCLRRLAWAIVEWFSPTWSSRSDHIALRSRRSRDNLIRLDCESDAPGTQYRYQANQVALVTLFNTEQFHAHSSWHPVNVKRTEFTPKQLPARTNERTPYGLEIIENCLSCPHREERLFCNLPKASVLALSAITHSAVYPKGANLFVEGQPARGIFILCSGRMALSTSSADGKTLILRIAESGEVIGLPATVTGTCYELTAEAIEPAQSKFIARNDFLAFLKDNGEAALRVAQQLGETYQTAIAEMRTIGLSHSAGEKLAHFLLKWTETFPEVNGQQRVKLTLTHEVIGQMIGSSRETVTRLLVKFRRNQWIQITGATLIIKNKSALEGIINGMGSPAWPRTQEECHVCT